LTSYQIASASQTLKEKYRLKSDEEIIHVPRAEVQKTLHLTDTQLAEYVAEVSLNLCANIITNTALEMYQDPLRPGRLSFGCPLLDSAFGGGIFPKGITEIVGEAGSGKSQLCMQLAVQAQLPVELGGLDGGVFYITTEGEFPLKRLHQIVDSFKQRYPTLESDDLTSKILIQKIPTIDDLWDLLENVRACSFLDNKE
jgi:RecA/RadA recombinase